MGLPSLLDQRREGKDESEMEDTLVQAISQEADGKNAPLILTRRVHSDAPKGGA